MTLDRPVRLGRPDATRIDPASRLPLDQSLSVDVTLTSYLPISAPGRARECNRQASDMRINHRRTRGSSGDSVSERNASSDPLVMSW